MAAVRGLSGGVDAGPPVSWMAVREAAAPAVRAVLFDLDDTLLVERAAVDATLDRFWDVVGTGAVTREHHAVFWEEAERRWASLPVRKLGDRLGIGAWEAMVSTFAGSSPCLAPFRPAVDAFRCETWPAVFDRAGRPARRLAPDEASALLRSIRQASYRVRPGVRQLLADLQASRVRVGVVTNGPPDLQHHKVAATGLGRLVDTVVVSGDVGVGKPEPEIFRRAAEVLGVAVGECLMVGDSLHHDVDGARSAGMAALHVLPEDRVSEALAELLVAPVGIGTVTSRSA